jgi:hypothetical protein
VARGSMRSRRSSRVETPQHARAACGGFRGGPSGCGRPARSWHPGGRPRRPARRGEVARRRWGWAMARPRGLEAGSSSENAIAEGHRAGSVDASRSATARARRFLAPGALVAPRGTCAPAGASGGSRASTLGLGHGPSGPFGYVSSSFPTKSSRDAPRRTRAVVERWSLVQSSGVVMVAVARGIGARGMKQTGLSSSLKASRSRLERYE